MLLLAGCGAAQGEFAIKSIPAPISAVAKPVAARVAEGQGLLATGNVGLAVEAFRKAQRDDARSTGALAGLAACYDQMGRFELSRRYYEQALAIAPADPAILTALARSLEAQGRTGEAGAVRRELAARPQAEPSVGPPDVQVARSDHVSSAPSAAPSVTVKLPPIADAHPVPVPRPPRETEGPSQMPAPAVRNSPRLERLSLAEVALVTTAQPRWRIELVRRTPASTTVRFVPLKPQGRESPVRLLNAARHQGLAARTRLTLGRKGWDRVSIGDADRVRRTSLVLYSSTTALAAHRLASEFNFQIAKEERPGPLTVLLGRDAVARTRSRT